MFTSDVKHQMEWSNNNHSKLNKVRSRNIN